MRTSAPTPRPVALSGYDCWGLLDQEEIARVAWAGADGVAVVPVNYAVSGGAVWFRAQPGTTLAQHCDGGRVAVEIDHLDRARWSAWSVVIRGATETISADDAPDDLVGMDVWEPGPHGAFVRVSPTEVTGRRLWGRPDEEES